MSVTRAKQQVVVIHGGDSFLRRKEYLRFLRSIKITAASLRPRSGWKANLAADLGRGWQVIRPAMPNDMNARYDEWKIWLEKYRPHIKANAIFIGHSQGGIFLAKYFSENSWPKKIRALILIAPPHKRTKGIGDFRLNKSLTRLHHQIQQVIIFHSIDDPVVRYSEMAAYGKALPNAVLRTLTNRGHINQTHFPELVRLIKKLSVR